MSMRVAEVGVGDLEGLFRGLLEKKVVDCLVMPYTAGKNIAYMLVTDPGKIESSSAGAIFAPSFSVNAAGIVKGWTIENKVALVAKPCEIRAAVELVKLNQMDKNSLLLISVDCSGTFENQVYAEHRDDIGDWVDGAKIEELKGKGIEIREACKICRNRLADVGDIGISRQGGEKVLIAGLTKMGEAALTALELPLEDKDMERKDEKAKIVEEAEKNEEALPKISSPEELDEFLKDCIVCKNCRDVCPVCYCKECFFDQPLGNPAGGDLLNLSELRGAIGVPTNRLFYHLTRVYHVSATCVGCGACADACPKEIPLTRYYPVITRKVQEMFDYEPGRDIEEPIPFTTYEEEELEDRLR